MVQKAKRVPTTSDKIKGLTNHKSTLYALNRTRISPTTSANAIFAINGGSAAGSTAAASNSLRTEGDTMIGPIAFYPKIAVMSNGQIDISETSASYSSKIIVTPESGTTDTLVTITGAGFAGQLLVLQGVETDTITIKDAASSGTAWVVSTAYSLGDIVSNNSVLYSCKQAHTSAVADEPGVGANWTDYWYKSNIETIDGTDFSLEDDDNLIFIYDTTDARWQQVTTGKQNLSGGPGGASFPLDYDIDDQGTKSSGTVTHDLSADTAHMLKFTIGGDVTVAFSNYPASGTGIDWYVEVTQDGTGGHTITWPAEVNPTISLTETAGTVSMIAFHTNDNGTTVRSITLLNAVATSVTNLSNIIIDTDFDAGGTYKYILDADNDTYLIADTDDRIEFFTAGTEKLRLDTELQLQGGVNLDLNGNDLVFGTGVGEYMDHGASSDIRVYTASTHRLSFNATGQLMEAGYRLTMEDEIRFTPITKPGSNTSAKIYAENLTNDELVLNAPTSGKVRMDKAGVNFADFGGTEMEFHSDTGYDLQVYRSDPTPTDDDVISTFSFVADNDDTIPLAKTYASIKAIQNDVTAGSEDGRLIFGVIDGGVANDTFMQLESINALGSKLTIQADHKDLDVEIVRGESTSDTGKIGSITFDTNNSDSSIRTFGEIRVDADVVTAGSERSDVTFKAYDEGTYVTFLRYIGGTGIEILGSTTEQLGFYGSTGSNKQTVTGSRGGNAALQGLLAALANLGLITDSST